MKLYSSIIISFFLFLGAGHTQTPFICEGQTYMTLTDGVTSDLVQVTFDPNTGDISLVPVLSDLQIVINAVGYRNVDNLIYGINPANYTLYQIDAIGNVAELAVLPLELSLNYLGADITKDGRYLVIVGGTQEITNGRDWQLAKVDLASPTFDVTVVPLSGPFTRMLDIAYDPITGELYGFDSSNNRLVKVDDATGVISAPFPSSNLLESAGSLFFNAFGDLFAYGSPDGFEQNTLISIDKNAGTFTIETMGPLAKGTDGCSCPYTIEMEKTVSPSTGFPCSQVTYQFIIANTSFSQHSDIDFSDMLPVGFIIDEVLKNPFGGNIISGVGTDELIIEDITVPPGVDSIVVRVTIGDVPTGIYGNQAVLTDLPPTLGNVRLSDDPRTVRFLDSTTLIVTEIPFDTLFVDEAICEGDTLVLDVSMFGLSYVWQDNSTESEFVVTESGIYQSVIQSPCDTVVVIHDVRISNVAVSIQASETDILFGDTVIIESEVLNSGNELFYQWTDPLETSLLCTDCPSTVAVPFEHVTYGLRVSNDAGCFDTDTISIRVSKDFMYFIPNVFTPNGDDRNDYFYVFSRAQATLSEFQIFSRWGDLVYERTNAIPNEPSFGWNGYFGNGNRPMEPGTYVYRVVLLFPDGSEEIVHGDVTLLR
jgi:gliding motility-associated-like protein